MIQMLKVLPTMSWKFVNLAKTPKDQSAALKDDLITDVSKDDFATIDSDEDQENSPHFDNSFSRGLY